MMALWFPIPIVTIVMTAFPPCWCSIAHTIIVKNLALVWCFHQQVSRFANSRNQKPPLRVKKSKLSILRYLLPFQRYANYLLVKTPNKGWNTNEGWKKSKVSIIRYLISFQRYADCFLVKTSNKVWNTKEGGYPLPPGQ